MSASKFISIKRSVNVVKGTSPRHLSGSLVTRWCSISSTRLAWFRPISLFMSSSISALFVFMPNDLSLVHGWKMGKRESNITHYLWHFIFWFSGKDNKLRLYPAKFLTRPFRQSKMSRLAATSRNLSPNIAAFTVGYPFSCITRRRKSGNLGVLGLSFLSCSV